MAQKEKDISRRWGVFWEEEGEAAVEDPFLAPISLKNIRHCHLWVRWKKQIIIVWRKPLS